MAIDLLLGLQWGDEGKGKIVDVLTKKYDIIARFQGGPNAGHTLEFDGIKHVLHTIPSGIFHPTATNLVGNGVVIDPVIFKQELDNLVPFDININKSLLVSRKAHLILPTHRLLDAASELAKGKAKIGSTLKGIGPTYMDKTGRNGIRVGDIELASWKTKYKALRNKHLAMVANMKVELEFDMEALDKAFFEAIDFLKSNISFVDSEQYLSVAQKEGKHILAEGAQGSLLDIDFGTYPFVTSSNTTSSQASIGSGLGNIKNCYTLGITKAYLTRVGEGPFPTEQNNSIGEKLGKIGNEFGTVTGRKRRCGWLDLVLLKQSVDICGIHGLALTKLDVLDQFEKINICISYDFNGKEYNYLPPIISSTNDLKTEYIELDGWNESTRGCRSYNELPRNAKKYIETLREITGVEISMLSTSPEREDTILFKDPF